MCQIDKQSLLSRLASYPLAFQCFSRYVAWVCDNVTDDLDKYDLITILTRNDRQRVQMLEERLQESCRILKVSLAKFARMFGFVDDLLTDDPEKVHDILAEPLFVIDLNIHGFNSIEKLPLTIRVNNQSLQVADFLAMHGSYRFAIELKTIRTETGILPGIPIGDGTKPNWWGQMLRNNAITKIEDKDKRAIRQLENTAHYYGCDQKMLVLYTRRLGPSTLLLGKEWLCELENLKQRYPEIDAFCAKSYFGEVVFFPQPLPGSVKA